MCGGLYARVRPIFELFILFEIMGLGKEWGKERNEIFIVVDYMLEVRPIFELFMFEIMGYGI